MIRGQTRPLPVAAEVENSNEIKAKFNASIHNRFDIEVVDAKTGEIRQRAQAENVICTKFWEQTPLTTSNNAPMSYMHVGGGAGVPSAADVYLFNKLGSYTVSQEAPQIDSVNHSISVKLTTTLSESTLAGSTITEVGAGDSTYIFTHAMIKDMNGNQISIVKTATDIINIYATIFLHWGDLGGFEIWEEQANKYYFELAFMRLHGWDPYAMGAQYNKLFANKYDYNSTNEGLWSYDASLKTVKYQANRIPISSCNLTGGITKIIVANMYNYVGGFATTLPASWYPGSNIVGEAIGTGDGATKDFATDFVQASNIKVYVDGVEQTSGVTFDAPSGTVSNNIHFAAAAASGAVITADYHTDVIAKDANHVFDFSMEIQFGEYTT